RSPGVLSHRSGADGAAGGRGRRRRRLDDANAAGSTRVRRCPAYVRRGGRDQWSHAELELYVRARPTTAWAATPERSTPKRNSGCSAAPDGYAEPRGRLPACVLVVATRRVRRPSAVVGERRSERDRLLTGVS